MTIENQNDVDGIMNAGRIVATVHDKMLNSVEPGMTTVELDELGGWLLESLGARSAPRVTYNFPGSTCISINEQAAHGIPGNRIIQPGDIVNIDVSAEFEGYFADTGGTIVVPPVTKVKARLCRATQWALKHALAKARAGAPINGVGKAIQRTARSHGFKTIKNLAGHGIGRSLHEEPEGIVSYFDRRDTRRLQHRDQRCANGCNQYGRLYGGRQTGGIGSFQLNLATVFLFLKPEPETLHPFFEISAPTCPICSQ